MLTSSERLTKYLLSEKIEKWPNLYNEKLLTTIPRDDPRVNQLFKEEFRDQVEERKEFIKKISEEYFDPQDNEKVHLIPDGNFVSKESLFDTNYDDNKNKIVKQWEFEPEMKETFSGSIFDIQIKNLDFFWSKFWIPKTEEELKEEKEKKEKKKRWNKC